MHTLPNGKIEVGPELEQVLQEEIDRLNAKLAMIKPKVEQDLKESREAHRRLWNY